MICRLCLCEYPQNELKNIFEYQVKNCDESLVDVLYWVFSVEVDIVDPYPKEACEKCLMLIEQVLQIRATFQETQLVLHGKEEKLEQTLPELTKIDLNENFQEIEERNVDKELSCSLPIVKVSLTNLEAMCPILDLPKLEKSYEFTKYKHLGFGKYKKRVKRCINAEEEEPMNNVICKILDTVQVPNNDSIRECIEVSTQTMFEESRPEMVSIGVNTNLILPAGLAEKKSGVPVADHISNKISGRRNDPHNLQLKSGHSMLDLLEIATHMSSMVDSRKSTLKNASTNTDIPIIKPIDTTIRLKDKIILDSNTFNNFSLGVWVEPLQELLLRENYTEIRKDCFVQNYEEEDEVEEEEEEDEEDEVQVFGAENKKEGIASKKKRLLNYYKNFRSFAVRELIEGKSIRENAVSDSNDLLFKVSDVQSVYLCKFCTKSFNSEIALKGHVTRTHKENNIIQERQVFECYACPIVFSSEKLLMNHTSNFHSIHDSDEPKVQSIENKSIEDSDTSNDMLCKVSNVQSVQLCDICSKSFNSILALKIHVTKHHKKNDTIQGKVPQAPIVIPSPKLLINHTSNSINDSDEPLEFKVQNVQSKIDRIQKQKDFPCEMCARVFPSARSLNGHNFQIHGRRKIKTKTKNRRKMKFNDMSYKVYRCPYCDKYFTEAGLFTHIRHTHSHHGTDYKKIVKCEMCGKSFKSEMLLKGHQTVYHGDDEKNKIYCTLCSKSYKANRAGWFRNHLITDHGIQDGEDNPTTAVTPPPAVKKEARRKTVSSYNINEIINNYRYRWIVKNKRKRSRLGNKTEAPPLNGESPVSLEINTEPPEVEKENENYFWNKKDLGEYTAATRLVRRYSDGDGVNTATEEPNHFEEVVLSNHKVDAALDETIRRLTERLVDPLEIPSDSTLEV